MSDWRALVERPEWMHAAACRGMDPELFFPARGEGIDTARHVCRSCDVRAECLAYCMSLDEHHGIWGGLSERDRRQLRRTRRLHIDVTARPA